MTLISLIVALLIEQVQPLNVERALLRPLRRLSDFLVDRFNDGQAAHGRTAWWVVVLPLVVVTALVFFLLWNLHPLLAWAFNVLVLYFTLGFRWESHYFGDIQLALRMGELDRARALLAEWRGRSYDLASSSEIARLAIEQALVSAHRNVFGVVFWFLILPGPSGAVLYRMGRFLAEDWGDGRGAALGDFGRFASRAFEVVDWVPVRLTAIAFAIVGNFEDAIFCWRSQAMQWPDKAAGILLASGGGALGVRLGMPIQETGEIVERPELGAGDEADADFMQSTVGLIWRSLVLCLLVLALLTLAGWVGH
ncbi:MAG: CobD/CbiB family protein [Rhodocyclaceae bacterium]|jgi:adenosylcobinamide-phosphate synthase|nr:CobD/CbiB family protein [Rhodocyclaceae bacterium]